MVVSEFAKKLINKTGKYSCVLVIFAVALNYWGILPIENVHPSLPSIFYIYIIGNGIFATPYIYLEKKAKVSLTKICPYCDTPLEKLPKYKYPNCGVLEPQKE